MNKRILTTEETARIRSRAMHEHTDDCYSLPRYDCAEHHAHVASCASRWLRCELPIKASLPETVALTRRTRRSVARSRVGAQASRIKALRQLAREIVADATEPCSCSGVIAEAADGSRRPWHHAGCPRGNATPTEGT